MRAAVVRRGNLRGWQCVGTSLPSTSRFGKTALPLFVGTGRSSLHHSKSAQRLVPIRPFSSSVGQSRAIGKNSWLSLGSILLATTLGAVSLRRSATVHAQEQGSEERDEETVEHQQEQEPEQQDDKPTNDKNDFVSYLLERPILLLLLDREDLDDKLDNNLEAIISDEELKGVHLLDYQFFTEDKSKFPTDALAVVYIFNNETKQMEAYRYPADMELTVDNVKQFLDDLNSHKLEDLRYHPSEPRLPEDQHPKVEHLKVMTGSSFKEVVLDADKDVLVYIHLPSPVPPTDLQALAQAYAEDDEVQIVECNSFLNELDPTYFGDTPIEGIKLFRKGQKENPITYHGKDDLLDIVSFLNNQRMASGVEAYRNLRKADSVRLLRNFEDWLTDYWTHTMSHQDFVPTSDKARQLFEQLFMMYGQLKADEDPFREKAESLRKKLQSELKDLERTGMRNIKVIEKESYKTELEEARNQGKPVVVFFWRKGCWPCKKLNPMIGQLSVDFPEITFLKVDADVEGLNATPAFHLYEGQPTPVEGEDNIAKDVEKQELSGIKLITYLHPLARTRGLPGYAKWLPPREREQLADYQEDEEEEKGVPKGEPDQQQEQEQEQEQEQHTEPLLKVPTEEEVTVTEASGAKE